jgi:hypothetical protein
MAKEKRYTVAKNLIETGGIKTVSDLLTILDKKAIYKDDAYAIAAVIGTDEMAIIQLIHNEWLSRKRKKPGH